MPDNGENKVLVINRSDTVCGNCGKGATYQEKKHETILGYSKNYPSKDGCGVEWTHVTSHYVGVPGLYERIQELRPDLIFIDPTGGKGWPPNE